MDSQRNNKSKGAQPPKLSAPVAQYPAHHTGAQYPAHHTSVPVPYRNQSGASVPNLYPQDSTPPDRPSQTLPRNASAAMSALNHQEPVVSSSPTQTDNGWHTLPKYYPNAANFNDAPALAKQGQSAKKNRGAKSPPPIAEEPRSPYSDEFDADSEPHAFEPYIMSRQYPGILQPYSSTPLGSESIPSYDSSSPYPLSIPRYIETPSDLYGRHSPHSSQSPYQRQGLNHVSPPIVPPPRSPIAPAHGHPSHKPESTSSPNSDGRRRHRHKPERRHKAAHPPPVTESAQAAQNLLAYCDELLADLEKVAKS